MEFKVLKHTTHWKVGQIVTDADLEKVGITGYPERLIELGALEPTDGNVAVVRVTDPDLVASRDNWKQRAEQAEAALQPFKDRNEQLATMVDQVIPTSASGLSGLNVEQLRLIAQHRKLDPIPDTRDALIAALKRSA